MLQERCLHWRSLKVSPRCSASQTAGSWEAGDSPRDPATPSPSDRVTCGRLPAEWREGRLPHTFGGRAARGGCRACARRHQPRCSDVQTKADISKSCAPLKRMLEILRWDSNARDPMCRFLTWFCPTTTALGAGATGHQGYLGSMGATCVGGQASIWIQLECCHFELLG